MVKPTVKKRVKFDEGRFFSYLRKNASPALLRFLRSIDRRACVEMTTYVIRYLRRSEEEPVFAERRRRGAEAMTAISETITSLRKTSVPF